MENKTLKIHISPNTDDIKYLSRIGAIVCTYSRHNPLHVFLEDGNFHEDLSSEIQWNEEERNENGRAVYLLTKEFIDGYNNLSTREEKLTVFHKAREKAGKYGDYLREKMYAAAEIPTDEGLGYRTKVTTDEIIYTVCQDEDKNPITVTVTFTHSLWN